MSRKKNISIGALAVIVIVLLSQAGLIDSRATNEASPDDVLSKAFATKESDLQVRGEGRVVKILPDDLKGSRHQRFIIRTSNNQSILIAHNIDLAPRVDNLSVGDVVQYFGEYEWNSKGGVIHWTHHDPNNRHPHGWLKHKGRTYD